MQPPARYRLIRTIASGGMAQVYEAAYTAAGGIERRVVIKRVLPEYAQQESLQPVFFDEARIASQLHHGGIVQVLDYGKVETSEFLVLEFVDGLDAARALARARRRALRLPSGVALHIMAEVAEALAYVHARRDERGETLGIIHRDVSPENILLSWDGDVKLSDFGIAVARERVARTQTGWVKGKAAFMSPEQARGETLTPATDCFSLGLTLESLLLDAPLRIEATQRGAEAHRNALRAAGLDAELVAWIAELTHFTPALRMDAAEAAQRAGEMVAERLGQSGRNALRSWLAPLRQQRVASSALDDLLGISLIAADESRRYSVSRDAAPAPLSQSLPPPPRGRSSRASPSAAPSRLKRSWFWIVLSAAMLLTIGAFAKEWMKFTPRRTQALRSSGTKPIALEESIRGQERGREAREPRTGRVASGASDSPPGPPSTSRPDLPSRAEGSRSAPPGAHLASPAAGVMRGRRSPARDETLRAPSHAPPSNEDAFSPRGWLRIGGRRFAGHEV